MKTNLRHLCDNAVICGFVLILAGCNFPQPGTTIVPPVESTNPSPTVTTSVVDLTANCPTATEETTAYVNRDEGYCLLYPSDFNVHSDSLRAGVTDFTGPILPPPPHSMDSVAPNISLEFNGPAEGLDSAGYAQKWLQVINGGAILPQTQTTIGGQPAIILNGIPGMLSGQGVFVVANRMKYALTVFPEPGQVTAIDADILRGWNTIANSLVFFPPQAEISVVKPADVCPQATATGNLYINERDGYCHLYPIDFSEDPQFEGRFVGGPVLTYDISFGGDIRTNINVGTFGYFPGETPRQVIESWMEFIDTTSLVDMTIGGSPAVAFIDPRGPWPNRTAFVNVDGKVYTILVQPYDPNRFPEGILYATKAWDMVTTSIRFFDQWH